MTFSEPYKAKIEQMRIDNIQNLCKLTPTIFLILKEDHLRAVISHYKHPLLPSQGVNHPWSSSHPSIPLAKKSPIHALPKPDCVQFQNPPLWGPLFLGDDSYKHYPCLSMLNFEVFLHPSAYFYLVTQSYNGRSPKIDDQKVQVPTSSHPSGRLSLDCPSLSSLKPEILLTPASLFRGSHLSLTYLSLSMISSRIFLKPNAPLPRR